MNRSLLGLAIASMLLATVSHAQGPVQSAPNVVVIGYDPAKPGVYRVEITVAECFGKTFPDYFDRLRELVGQG